MTAAQIDGDPPPDAGPVLGHQALIYSSPDELTSCGVDFLRQGLERGDSVVLATPNAAGLVDALGTHADRVDVVDDRSWHRVPAWTIGGYARRTERAARRKQRLRVLTEIRWDEPSTIGQWQCYEAVLNTALAGLPVDLCCAYDARGLGADVVEAARRTHPSTLGPSGVESSASFVPAVEFLASGPRTPRLTVPSDALRVEFGAAEIPAVRQTALRWAREGGMTEDDANEFLIAIYEIASNAVEHGGGRGVGRFWSEAGRLFCDIWSAQQIVDPLTAGYRPPGTAQERGRGLWLARQICERVTIYNNGGATVQLARSVESR